jgi:hypothetical protein
MEPQDDNIWEEVAPDARHEAADKITAIFRDNPIPDADSEMDMAARLIQLGGELTRWMVWLDRQNERGKVSPDVLARVAQLLRDNADSLESLIDDDAAHDND